MPTVICVRHGNTFLAGEEPRRVGGRTDLPLVPSGEAQAVKLGQHFAQAGVTFSEVMCSPLRRTRQTAELILQTMGMNVAPQTAEFLREIDYGPDEDQPESVVRARLGEHAVERWESDGIVPDGWQLNPPLLVQAWRDFFQVQREHASDHVTLVVTSNGIARFLLDACDEGVHTVSSRKIRTGAFGEIQLADGRTRLLRWDIRP